VIGYQLLTGDVARERPGGKAWRRSLLAEDTPEALLDLLEASWDDSRDERPGNADVFLAQLGTAIAAPTKTAAERLSLDEDTQPREEEAKPATGTGRTRPLKARRVSGKVPRSKDTSEEPEQLPDQERRKKIARRAGLIVLGLIVFIFTLFRAFVGVSKTTPSTPQSYQPSYQSETLYKLPAPPPSVAPSYEKDPGTYDSPYAKPKADEKRVK
jgi:hypothetical protein